MDRGSADRNQGTGLRKRGRPHEESGSRSLCRSTGQRYGLAPLPLRPAIAKVDEGKGMSPDIDADDDSDDNDATDMRDDASDSDMIDFPEVAE